MSKPKYFNELLDLNSIIRCYQNNKFPNAYCLLWNQAIHKALATEVPEIIVTEMKRKVVEIDGGTKLSIY